MSLVWRPRSWFCMFWRTKNKWPGILTVWLVMISQKYWRGAWDPKGINLICRKALESDFVIYLPHPGIHLKLTISVWMMVFTCLSWETGLFQKSCSKDSKGPLACMWVQAEVWPLAVANNKQVSSILMRRIWQPPSLWEDKHLSRIIWEWQLEVVNVDCLWDPLKWSSPQFFQFGGLEVQGGNSHWQEPCIYGHEPGAGCLNCFKPGKGTRGETFAVTWCILRSLLFWFFVHH